MFWGLGFDVWGLMVGVLMVLIVLLINVNNG